ncbi:MAG: hypothetical protein ACRCXL_08370, partial [Dermatophilaceae bacterium]
APVSPTAFEAKWFQLDLTAKGQITAVAGAPAGAHSNTRWSTWTGTADGVRELTQPFQTFGGWGAGEVNGYLRTPGGEAIIGSWEGSTGLDIAVWRFAGERWTRTPTAAGSALASTTQQLAGARRAAPRGAGAIASGSVTELRPGSVRLRPAVWLTDSLDAPWRRVDLPSSAAFADAHAAGCSSDRCTVVGQADGRLVAWLVAADGEVTPVEGLPPVGVGDKVQLLAPMPADDGAHRFVVADGAEGRVVEVAADGAVSWRPYSAPGVPVAATTTAAGVAWVVHRATDGATALHTMPN